MITLHDYQRAAVKKTMASLHGDTSNNPLIVIPTGGGKSFVVAKLASRLTEEGKRVLIITPRVKLLKQNARLLDRHGVLSASIAEDHFDDGHNLLIGTYQTLIRRRDLQPDVVIVDECHLIPDDDSEFRQLLNRFDVPVIGLSATPFRKKQAIYSGANAYFSRVFEISIRELIERGFLVPPKTIRTGFDGREFVDQDEFLATVIPDLVETIQREDRSRIIVFASSIESAKRVGEHLALEGEDVRVLHSGPDADPDDEIYLWYHDPSPNRKWLVNIEKATTGVDIPEIDAVVVLRRITSLSTWLQIIGRGLRIATGKANCLILDYGRNVSRFGTIDSAFLASTWKSRDDMPPPLKECPACGNILHTTIMICDCCGYEFPVPVGLDAYTSSESLLSIGIEAERVVRIEERISGAKIILDYHLQNGITVQALFIKGVAGSALEEARKYTRVLYRSIAPGVYHFQSGFC